MRVVDTLAALGVSLIAAYVVRYTVPTLDSGSLAAVVIGVPLVVVLRCFAQAGRPWLLPALVVANAGTLQVAMFGVVFRLVNFVLILVAAVLILSAAVARAADAWPIARRRRLLLIVDGLAAAVPAVSLVAVLLGGGDGPSTVIAVVAVVVVVGALRLLARPRPALVPAALVASAVALGLNEAYYGVVGYAGFTDVLLILAGLLATAAVVLLAVVLFRQRRSHPAG